MYIFTTLEIPTYNFDFHLLTTSVNLNLVKCTVDHACKFTEFIKFNNFATSEYNTDKHTK